MPSKSDELKKIYQNRFSEKDNERRKAIWQHICGYLQNSFCKIKLSSSSIVVDVAAGSCDFINNIFKDKKVYKYAIDMNPDVKKYAAKGVVVYNDNVQNMEKYFEKNSVTLFFQSNFFEHLTKEQIRSLLELEYNLLEPKKGRVLILNPNIRYCGEKYWDFYDHITPLTEKSLVEVAELVGFKVEKCLPKFLPFTTKSRLPQWGWIVWLYLKLLPLSGWFFGEQSLILLRK